MVEQINPFATTLSWSFFRSDHKEESTFQENKALTILKKYEFIRNVQSEWISLSLNSLILYSIIHKKIKYVWFILNQSGIAVETDSWWLQKGYKIPYAFSFETILIWEYIQCYQIGTVINLILDEVWAHPIMLYWMGGGGGAWVNSAI